MQQLSGRWGYRRKVGILTSLEINEIRRMAERLSALGWSDQRKANYIQKVLKLNVSPLSVKCVIRRETFCGEQ